ncbi:MAG: hypothetical protein KQH57_09075 [Actinomycetales bacterium]|nr:hypothetical protein [Actinomycetales bacterium]
MIVGLLTLLALTACTQPANNPTVSPTVSTPTTTTTAPSSSPTPTVDPAVAEAEALILEAYRGYWAAKVASYADPGQPQDPNLTVFAIDTALADAQATLFQLKRDGVRLVGEPVLSPVVSKIDLDGGGTAEITDCVNSANWTPVSVRSGEPVAAPDQYVQVQAVATAYFFDGRWTVRAFAADRSAPC